MSRGPKHWQHRAESPAVDARQATAAPVSAPEGLTLEEAEARASAALAEVTRAQDEEREAKGALEALRPALADAASRGFEAAREAQRRIGEAEARVRAAEEVRAALEAVYRPLDDVRGALYRERRAETLRVALLEKLSERDAIDAEMGALLLSLRETALRRVAADRQALALHEEARSFGGDASPGREVARPLWSSMKAGIRDLPSEVRQAFAASL